MSIIPSTITFHAPVARLNRPSKDGRVLCYADTQETIRRRELPLHLVSNTPDKNHSDTKYREAFSVSRSAGAVEDVWVESEGTDVFLMARGTFTNSPWGWHVAGALEVGLVNLQLDLDDTTTCRIEGDDDLELMIFTSWRVMGITVSSGPGAWDIPYPTVSFPPGYGSAV